MQPQAEIKSYSPHTELRPYRRSWVLRVSQGVVETKEVSALAMGQSNPFIRNVYESSPPFTCGQGVQMSARITGRITGNAEGGGRGRKGSRW